MNDEQGKPFITVAQASATYPVFVGRGLLDQVGRLVRPRGRVFVITSSALVGRFGERVARSFTPPAEIITIEEGEKQKTLATAEQIVTELLERGAKRDSMAVVVGGGMIGDTAGFAASIFLRGIDLVQVPTTLLAQVDSSIGGKVAVNHAKGKNLVGSFHPPVAVVADTEVVNTLARRELLSGVFESLKGGVIGDTALFETFETKREKVLALDPDVIDDLIGRAIRVKGEIVSADERESNVRRLLNYGHTIGHGIEAAMNYEGITHGEAIAWGMIGANEIAVHRGLLPDAVRRRIDRTILSYEPAVPRVEENAILAAAEHDKKNVAARRIMVLPREIGKCEIVEVTEEDVRRGIQAIRSQKAEGGRQK